MDIGIFTVNSPGTRVQIPHPELPSKTDWAFVPDQLPPKWNFDPALWPLISEASTALGTLNGIGQTLPNPELLVSPLQTRESISSSSIEGTYVTPQQLLMFGLDPKPPRSAHDKAGDWFEVFNYGAALRTAHNMLCKGMPPCHRVFRAMHEILMRGARTRSASPGEYRKWQIQIGHTGRFIPPPPSEIDRLMDNFEFYLNNRGDSLHPLVCAFIAHYQFEAIHPFEDGNGRIGRALLSLLIADWLGHSMPWLYLSAFFEKFKDEYIDGLFRVSTHGNWSAWIAFCLRGTISQANDSINRCHGFNHLKKRFHELVANPTPKTDKIIEGLFINPVVSIMAIKESQHIAYGTAKDNVARLVDAGILKEIQDSYPKSFYAPEIMRIAYDPRYVADDEAMPSTA